MMTVGVIDAGGNRMPRKTAEPFSTTPRSAIDNWGKKPEPEKPHEPGPVEKAVEADIAAIGRIGLGRVFMAESARKLARAIDARGDDEAPSALAKAVDSLFKVMNALAAKDDGGTDDRGRLEAALGVSDAGSPAVSPPLRYPKEPRPANRRTRNR
jgi:hypothetical protein